MIAEIQPKGDGNSLQNVLYSLLMPALTFVAILSVSNMADETQNSELRRTDCTVLSGLHSRMRATLHAPEPRAYLIPLNG